MNYELAKQLKDAGFKGLVTAWKAPDGNGMSTASVEGWSEVVLPPTLEELIEACGENCAHITQTSSRRWSATTPFLDAYGRVVKSYDTPTEAVANLWLALHANKQAA